MKRLVIIYAIFFIVACSANSAMATLWAESGDAGELLSTAQVLPVGSDPLNTITGELISSDADMYLIYISDAAGFSASTLGSVGNDDTQLFLFDASGMGVYSNDDWYDPLSYLPPGDPNSPTSTGNYYLAISGYGYDPYSATGLIFPEDSYDVARGPTGPGGLSPIADWGGSASSGTYSIELTGAQYPVPGAVLLGILGLGVVGLKLRKYA